MTSVKTEIHLYHNEVVIHNINEVSYFHEQRVSARIIISSGDAHMDTPFMGQIQLFAFNFAPNGWSACEGQLLSISQNTALFSLLGTTFGGDGQNTFALPDLRGKAPVDGLAYYIAITGIFPSRQ